MFAEYNVNVTVEMYTALLGGLIGIFILGIGAVAKWGLPEFLTKNPAKVLTILALLCGAVQTGNLGYNWHQSQLFQTGFVDYIKAAFLASNRDDSIKYMRRAKNWLDDHKSNQEMTAVVYTGPQYNVQDWTEKVDLALEGIEHKKPTAVVSSSENVTATTESWRECLINSGLVARLEEPAKANGSNVFVQYPPGIELYPNNKKSLAITLCVLLLGLSSTAGAVVLRLTNRNTEETKKSDLASTKTVNCQHCGQTVRV